MTAVYTHFGILTLYLYSLSILLSFVLETSVCCLNYGEYYLERNNRFLAPTGIQTIPRDMIIFWLLFTTLTIDCGYQSSMVMEKCS